jgi:hypothetical protein
VLRPSKALGSVWKQLKWDLWLDGRHVSLPRFGTSERTLYYFPPAGGKNVILREWNVILVGVTPGKHLDLTPFFGPPVMRVGGRGQHAIGGRMLPGFGS